MLQPKFVILLLFYGQCGQQFATRHLIKKFQLNLASDGPYTWLPNNVSLANAL